MARYAYRGTNNNRAGHGRRSANEPARDPRHPPGRGRAWAPPAATLRNTLVAVSHKPVRAADVYQSRSRIRGRHPFRRYHAGPGQVLILGGLHPRHADGPDDLAVPADRQAPFDGQGWGSEYLNRINETLSPSSDAVAAVDAIVRRSQS